ncbi:CLUMA_CG015179, isoform A [Clunio marinus]|uniref:CLUMA_CG015179, isoform A n=1 Tax=Clunio marinus TaxID=568069 RepID=A0A1J1INW6_9DIPT|nr:CLUMA_CG015179, isoform A [Clunio marinus]
MMEVDSVEEQHIVNGSMMKNFVGKTVRVFLNVEFTSTGGRKISGKSTDKTVVNVALESPLNQPLSGWIEVIGKPVSASTLNCSEIIVFPHDENAEPFDEESHNALVMLMNNMRDFYDNGADSAF